MLEESVSPMYNWGHDVVDIGLFPRLCRHGVRAAKMAESAHATLMVHGGPNNRQTIPLAGRPITLGRRPDNDIVVNEGTVSRRHALIMETPDGFVVRDLSSTNGTFVNRDKIGSKEHVLKHGDRIRLAGSEVSFVFRQEGASTLKLRVESPRAGADDLSSRASSVGTEATETAPRPEGKELDLLRFLESKEGAPVSREEIARFVWPELPMGSATNQEMDRTVERLRAQIEEDVSRPVRLITVGEYGYLLILEEER